MGQAAIMLPFLNCDIPQVVILLRKGEYKKISKLEDNKSEVHTKEVIFHLTPKSF